MIKKITANRKSDQELKRWLAEPMKQLTVTERRTNEDMLSLMVTKEHRNKTSLRIYSRISVNPTTNIPMMSCVGSKLCTSSSRVEITICAVL